MSTRFTLLTLLLLSALFAEAADFSQRKLIVAGGGKLPPEIYQTFIDLAGGPKKRFLAVPQASARATAGESIAKVLQEYGASKIEILDLTNPAAARKQIQDVDAIWFGGGSQSRLMEALEKAGVDDDIRSRLNDGIAFGGSSAGAAVQSDLMIAGDTLPIDRGLGLWPEVIVDQHFVARKRFNRSLGAIMSHPNKLGVGIGESTAAVVTGSSFRVIGSGVITVIDAREATQNGDSQGRTNTWHNIRTHWLHAGDAFAFTEPALSPVKGSSAIVIHGGAGRISPDSLNKFGEHTYRRTLTNSLKAANAILRKGGASLDAIEAAIAILEDSPLFNAGKGAVFTSAGENELDASIMDGKTMKAGAVGGVTVVRNPIRAARAVMEQTPHVLLTGDGADDFAKSAKLDIVDRSYFHTDHRWQSWQKRRNQKPGLKPDEKEKRSSLNPDYKYSTVGAVALDRHGSIAAGTSTGGLTNKRFGRIGDSPIIAAGTYADNRYGGISCTGHGEFFIRHAVAYDIIARTRYLKTTLQQSADKVVKDELVKAGGGGGIIGLDPAGNIVTSFNTPSMFRGWIDTDGNITVQIYKN